MTAVRSVAFLFFVFISFSYRFPIYAGLIPASVAEIKDLIEVKSPDRTAPVCCVCEFASDSPIFQRDCENWLQEQDQCSVKVKRQVRGPIGQWPVCGSDLPENCSSILYHYEGHSDGGQMNPFIDRISSLCLYCPNVEGVIVGCRTFSDPQAAQDYLNNLPLPADVQLEIWGAQCVISGNQGRCGVNGCKISYGCTKPKISKCKDTDRNSTCFIGTTWGSQDGCKSIQCAEEDGSLATRKCCPDNPDCGIDAYGTITCTGKWKKPEDCPKSACEGACCIPRISKPYCFDDIEQNKGECIRRNGRWMAEKKCPAGVDADTSNFCGEIGSCCVPNYIGSGFTCREALTKKECENLGGPVRGASKWHKGLSCYDSGDCNTTGSCCLLLENDQTECESMRKDANACYQRIGTDFFLGHKKIIDAVWRENQFCGEIPDCARPKGACCILNRDGTSSCTMGDGNRGVSEAWCRYQRTNPNVQETKWHLGKRCDEVNCDKGACCLTWDCPGPGHQCSSQKTLPQCDLLKQQAEQNNPGCQINKHWYYDKYCHEINCNNSSCVTQHPGAYHAESCLECYATIPACSLHPELCWAWCTQEPDGQGQYCCGPI